MNKKRKELLIFTLIFTAIIGLWFGSGYFIYFTFCQDRGVVGDMFGAINALFSGFAILGLIYTLYLQHKDGQQHRKESLRQYREMNRQRRDTTLMIGQLAAQTEQFEAQTTVFKDHASLFREQNDVYRQQVDEMRKQTGHMLGQVELTKVRAFEDNLQNLIQAAEKEASNVKAYANRTEVSGAEAFVQIERELSTSVIGPSNQPFREQNLEGGVQTVEQFATTIQRYVDFITSAFDCVENLQAEDKEKYIKSITAHISPAQLAVLAFYGLTPRGISVKDFIIKNSLLLKKTHRLPEAVSKQYES